MSDSAGFHAKGAVLELNTTLSAGSWAAVAEVVDIEPSKIKFPAASATHLLSPATEKKPAIEDDQPFKMTLNYTYAQYNTIRGYDGTIIFARITLPKAAGQSSNGDRFVYEGWFSEVPHGPDKIDPMDTKVMQATFEFTPTGKSTYSQGA